ncbi:MAG TPA: hypothetical protein VJ647_04780, partial [Chitinophagaceae bacterium]|nr:hypothetical protein [Chitinophagaceae bacterium]
ARRLLDHKPVSLDAAGNAAPLRSKLEKRVETLLEKRRAELQQGLAETETRKTLSELKAITDQFSFIAGIAGDIKKISPD